MHCLRLGIIVLAMVWGGLVPKTGLAATDLNHVCDRAALQASAETGVPVAVLRAITRTETGRKRGGRVMPWPWTVNMEGKGAWFDTEDAAKSFVFQHFKRGARSFDVGCFQINYRWHGEAFASIEEMFDPLANARYAADFLKRLHGETDDWSRAAGAYHSRTAVHATRYRKTFDAHFAKMRKADPPPASPATDQAPAPEARVNRYPLLQSGILPGRAGSLVPMRPPEAAARRAFVDLEQDREQDRGPVW